MSYKRTTHTSSIDALDALLKSLTEFEHKYQMASDEFYKNYLSGKLEDSKDFIEWAGDYKQYIDLKRDLEEKLKATA